VDPELKAIQIPTPATTMWDTTMPSSWWASNCLWRGEREKGYYTAQPNGSVLQMRCLFLEVGGENPTNLPTNQEESCLFNNLTQEMPFTWLYLACQYIYTSPSHWGVVFMYNTAVQVISEGGDRPIICTVPSTLWQHTDSKPAKMLSLVHILVMVHSGYNITVTDCYG
jgi:hypothetical protein